MRPDRLGLYGASIETSPNLDRFARESVVFTQNYAQSNETLFSHASLFTSRYPSELGHLSYSFRLPEGVPTLAEVLQVYGYRTMASVAGGHLAVDFGFQKGFQQYTSSEDWGSLYHTIPPALRWIDSLQEQEPWFLFLHGYDCHYRYLKPPPFGLIHARARPTPLAMDLAARQEGTTSVLDGWLFAARAPLGLLDYGAPRIWSPEERERLEALSRDPATHPVAISPEDQAFFRAAYDGAVSYADAMFGIFMSELDRRGILDRAIVAIISDHGEELGENGLFNHRFTMSDESTRTVLAIRLPMGRRGDSRVDALTGLIDLQPTLLDYAGAQAPAGIQGRSLRPALEGESFSGRSYITSEGAFRMISLRTRESRLTFSGLSAESPFLQKALSLSPLGGPAFDLQPATATSSMQSMREKMLEWRGSLHPVALSVERPDERLLQELRERGYWEAR